MDPHFHNYSPNLGVHMHIYEKLISFEDNGFVNALAEEVIKKSDLIWSVKLRKNIFFHNGQEMKAEDVKFSFERPKTLKKSPNSFVPYLRKISEIKIISPYELEFHTSSPEPLLKNFMSYIAIMPIEAWDEKTQKLDIIGTGPYKFIEWIPNQKIRLTRNPYYWRYHAKWDEIIIRPIGQDFARISALLSGEVDMIDNLLPSHVSRIKNTSHQMAKRASSRLIYLQMDQFRDDSPFILDHLGNKLDTNPLKDARVRKAISLAINRNIIVDKIMMGMAKPAGQLVISEFKGHIENRQADLFNPAQAKALLTEAGYPNGFQLTLHAPNDRYVQDEQIAMAIANMLSKIGIKTQVKALPRNIFFPNASKLKYSFMLLGWASGTGDAYSPLKSLIHSHDKEKGFGAANRGRFSNTEIDSYIEQINIMQNEQGRIEYMRLATEKALDLHAIIPLHFQEHGWAYIKKYYYQPDNYSTIWSENVFIDE